MNASLGYVQRALRTMIERGALMSKANARRAYIAVFLGTLLVVLFVSIALEAADGNDVVKEYLSWTVVGFLSVGFVTMPPVLYGYHNRYRIDTTGVKEAYDFSDAYRAGIAAAIGVPALKALFDWLAQG